MTTALMGLLGGAVATSFFVAVPFSVAMGLYLGLHGARFGALMRIVLVALLVALLLAAIVLATAPWHTTIPRTPRAIALFAAVPPWLVWGPEIALAIALAVHGYLHRHDATRTLPSWIAGPALGVSVETLLWWRALSMPLENPSTAGAADLLGLSVAGFCGAAMLATPGWLVGRMIHDLATPPRTMSGAWMVWPCWIVASLAMRLLARPFHV